MCQAFAVNVKHLTRTIFVPHFAASVVWCALASCQHGPSARVALLEERLRLMVHQQHLTSVKPHDTLMVEMHDIFDNQQECSPEGAVGKHAGMLGMTHSCLSSCLAKRMFIFLLACIG